MIQFKKLIVHNFASYAHSEVDLTSKGFCLVTGQNLDKRDNSLSNGSGKSFLWSGICYTLVGETIQGIKNGLKNKEITEDLCYTSVELEYDGSSYVITRHIQPKSDLKIVKDGTDVSGKGLRESEKRLAELIPDLNKEIIASSIIIGQKMPNKFSAHSPSGRKELLEKLSKSDFMIEDIKTRIADRKAELEKQLRIVEDSALINSTQLNTATANITNVKKEISDLVKPNFEEVIEQSRLKLQTINNSLKELENTNEKLTKKLESANANLLVLNTDKSNSLLQETAKYNLHYKPLYESWVNKKTECNSINAEIIRIESMRDTCPTCGQKLLNVVKPDTTKLKEDYTNKVSETNAINVELNNMNEAFNKKSGEIEASFAESITKLTTEIADTKTKLSELNNSKNTLNNNLNIETANYNKLCSERDGWDNYITKLQTKLAGEERTEQDLKNQKVTLTEEVSRISEHLGVVKQIENLVKRDFRGYLLADIIRYINNRAKDYCEVIFKTRDIEFYIDGNALDISYGGKLIDNLSGGEQQRVDLILQFAIRDMLANYLNISSNILVLDEITDALDKVSCNAVMDLIQQELNTTESVFIISHHANELEIPVDTELRVVKHESGISEVY